MTRTLIVSVALLGMVTYFIMRWESTWIGSQPPRVTRIDIHADRIEYRTRQYQTATALAIGLKAANDPPQLIELHHCGGLDALQSVVEVVRADGHNELEIVLPDGC